MYQVDDHVVGELERRGWKTGFDTGVDMLRDRNAYLRLKLAVKKGAVGWLHIRLTMADEEALKSATQICRAQHRVGARWLLEWPPDMPGNGLDALGALRGVRTGASEGPHKLLTNLDGVEDQLARAYQRPTAHNHRELARVIIIDILDALKARTEHADLFISRDLQRDTTNDLRAKRIKAATDEAAVGGLRNPRGSVEHSTEALTVGRVIRGIINDVMGDSDASAILSSLGRTDAPPPN